MLITGLSSGGENNPDYIKPLTGVGFWRHSDPTVAFTLPAQSHAFPTILWNVSATPSAKYIQCHELEPSIHKGTIHRWIHTYNVHLYLNLHPHVKRSRRTKQKQKLSAFKAP